MKVEIFGKTAGVADIVLYIDDSTRPMVMMLLMLTDDDDDDVDGYGMCVCLC